MMMTMMLTMNQVVKGFVPVDEFGNLVKNVPRAPEIQIEGMPLTKREWAWYCSVSVGGLELLRVCFRSTFNTGQFLIPVDCAYRVEGDVLRFPGRAFKRPVYSTCCTHL